MKFVLVPSQGLDDYYKRNYKDYFEFVGGSAEAKKDEELSESETGNLSSNTVPSISCVPLLLVARNLSSDQQIKKQHTSSAACINKDQPAKSNESSNACIIFYSMPPVTLNETEIHLHSPSKCILFHAPSFEFAITQDQ